MYYIVRTHSLPDHVRPHLVRKKYMEEFERTNVLMAEWDINFWIRKTFSRRSSLIIQRNFVFHMNFEEYMESIKHDTMVQQWLKRKKRKPVEISYKKSRKKTTCSICLESTGLFVQIQPCKCLFHKDCIMRSCTYSIMCPLCNKPIKEKNIPKNVKKAKNE